MLLVCTCGYALRNHLIVLSRLEALAISECNKNQLANRWFVFQGMAEFLAVVKPRVLPVVAAEAVEVAKSHGYMSEQIDGLEEEEEDFMAKKTTSFLEGLLRGVMIRRRTARALAESRAQIQQQSPAPSN